MRKELTQERLKEVLHYDPETGDWTWLVRKANRIYAGSKAGGVDTSEGYYKIGVDGRVHKAHRLAFLYMTGEYPKSQVDHINGEKSDNRWGNLREASPSENLRNVGAYSSNVSGLKGVSYRPKADMYLSRITVDGVTHYLGWFSCPREASHAYNKAAIQFHGEFAVLNPI